MSRRHLVISVLWAPVLVAVLGSPAMTQTTHTVNQVANNFVPANVVIDVGDTVEWIWSNSTHTVTEGAGPFPSGGEAFNELHDAANPVVRVTFDRTFLKAYPRTDNLYDYYCIPHFASGQVGTIVVRETLGMFADGSQENPPSGATGTGSGSFTLDQTTNTLAWSLSYSGLGGAATGAHFHAGAVGVNGGIEISIGTSNPNTGSAVLTSSQAAAALSGGWYFNVHTAANPGGEIRGQIHSGDWDDLGGGTAGINGVPRLRGIGTLTGFSTIGLDLSDGPPLGLCLLWISISSSPVNALGGTVHAVPFLDQVLLGTDANGRFAAATLLGPFIPPGSNIYFQFILQDLSVLWNLTLSNAVRSTTP